ncbi:MAG: cytochrome C oxidase subunit IV family protein [Egibacteraceae bacterium]
MVEKEEGHSHPGVAQYVEIGVILAVLTAVEVTMYIYREPLGSAITVPALLALTAIKFMLVVLWFMHLRFDHKMFRRVFFFGVALATVVFGIVGAMFYLGGIGF